jgi:micrococcal nuclease
MNQKKKYKYNAAVVRVVDGDTIDVSIDLGFKIFSVQRIRLKGVDTPEIYGRTTPEEKELGKAASEYVKELLPVGKQIVVETSKNKKGKYGRYLAVIWVDGQSLNQMLIESGHGEAI